MLIRLPTTVTSIDGMFLKFAGWPMWFVSMFCLKQLRVNTDHTAALQHRQNSALEDMLKYIGWDKYDQYQGKYEFCVHVQSRSQAVLSSLLLFVFSDPPPPPPPNTHTHKQKSKERNRLFHYSCIIPKYAYLDMFYLYQFESIWS